MVNNARNIRLQACIDAIVHIFRETLVRNPIHREISLRIATSRLIGTHHVLIMHTGFVIHKHVYYVSSSDPHRGTAGAGCSESNSNIPSTA